MAQFLRPDADITTTNWTTAPLFSKLNETSADSSGTTFIRNGAGALTACEVGLSDPAGTPNSGTCTVRIYAVASGGGAAERVTVTIVEGTSVIATPINDLSVSRATFTLITGTFSTTAVSDWTNLRARISMSTGGASEFISVSWLEVETPDAGKPRKIYITQ